MPSALFSVAVYERCDRAKVKEPPQQISFNSTLRACVRLLQRAC
ncbi:hypothetical protein [uncultured Nostoc sp.]|nr:hypothetical protein [uncultured Nostoc sp.]